MDYDDDFMFLNEGNDAAEEAPAPSNEVRKVNVNSKGQKVRNKFEKGRILNFITKS